MAKFLDIPFNSVSDFAQCGTLAANGTYDTGANLPTGIPGSIWIADGVCNMYLNRNDADVLGWNRTEIDFGQFPAATGEFWSSFEFSRHWSHNVYVVIGSWSVLINDASGTTYVPIGFRIRDGRFIIQAPRDLGTIGFNNQILGSVPVSVGGWHRVVTHVNLKADGTGFREVFFDGVPMFRQWLQATTYSTATGHYFKLGPYDGNHEREIEEALLLIRNVSLWSGNDGYQTVMGGVPISPPRLLYWT